MIIGCIWQFQLPASNNAIFFMTNRHTQSRCVICSPPLGFSLSFLKDLPLDCHSCSDQNLILCSLVGFSDSLDLPLGYDAPTLNKKNRCSYTHTLQTYHSYVLEIVKNAVSFLLHLHWAPVPFPYLWKVWWAKGCLGVGMETAAQMIGRTPTQQYIFLKKLCSTKQ